MNKRIFTKLYKEAWGYFPCPAGEPELEKFAELIVQECAKIAELKEQGSNEYDPNVSVGWYIRQHFGVEE